MSGCMNVREVPDCVLSFIWSSLEKDKYIVSIGRRLCSYLHFMFPGTNIKTVRASKFVPMWFLFYLNCL